MSLCENTNFTNLTNCMNLYFYSSEPDKKFENLREVSLIRVICVLKRRTKQEIFEKIIKPKIKRAIVLLGELDEEDAE